MSTPCPWAIFSIADDGAVVYIGDTIEAESPEGALVLAQEHPYMQKYMVAGTRYLVMPLSHRSTRVLNPNGERCVFVLEPPAAASLFPRKVDLV